jgi:hypothetical protein
MSRFPLVSVARPAETDVMNQAMRRGEAMLTTLPREIEWFTDLEYGEALQPITTQAGRVRALGSFWAAELAYPDCRSVTVGESVLVMGRKGLTLMVVPSDYRLPNASNVGHPHDRLSMGWLKKMTMFLL